MPKIRDRNLFDAQGYSQATEALKTCELDFQLFTEQVYEAQLFISLALCAVKFF
ncbi:hypothetical protein [Nostoc sp.]|uniref:hypothetical protein n=1 Tax=Nostoc sp. TaxID=1180 RepID=UPI003FA5D2B0